MAGSTGLGSLSPHRAASGAGAGPDHLAQSEWAARGSVLILLRLEGLAIAALSAAFYARTGASWVLFATLWLMPDLSILGYLRNPCWGARMYNAVHSYVAPCVLGLTAILIPAHALLPLALIWVNHIGVDRLLGYGLKYGDGFGWTHLGRLGKGALGRG